MKRYGKAKLATNDVIWPLFFACWVTKATDTHPEYVILIVFDDNSGYANAPQYYVIRTLPVLCLRIMP